MQVSAITLLGVLFVGLKLGGVIDWSWWWVTLPFWGGLAVATAILAVGVVALAADETVKVKRARRVKRG